MVLAASLLLGGLTFFAQGWLPEALTSFANSASGWTLLTVLLVYGARASTVLSSVLGAVSFVLLVLGYTWTAALMGLFYSPVLFGVVGVVVGPFVGAAAAWLRSRSQWRIASAVALVAGIGIGEGGYGLTWIAETTSPVYWVLIASAGAALLIGVAIRRLREPGALAIAVVGTAGVAIAFNLAYRALGGIG